MRRIGVYCAAPLRLVKVEKSLLEITFISLSAKVITRMSLETLVRTLNTPSGKEMSLQFDRSAQRKKVIRKRTNALCRHLLVKPGMVRTGHSCCNRKRKKKKENSYLNNLSLPRQLHLPSGPHLRLLQPFFFSYLCFYRR